MEIIQSEEIETIQYISVREYQDSYIDTQLNQLNLETQFKWECFQKQIKEYEESKIIVSMENQISQIIQKQGIQISYNDSQCSVKVQTGYIKSIHQYEIKAIEQKYLKTVEDMGEQITNLKLVIQKQQIQIFRLGDELRIKDLDTQRIVQSYKLHQEKIKQQIIRFQKQNKILLEQQNRLKLILLEPHRKEDNNHSDQTINRRLPTTDYSIQTQSNLNQKTQEQHQDNTLGEENKYLRQMISDLNSEIESFNKQKQKLIKQSKLISSPGQSNSNQNINLKNKISSLESTNRILTHQNQDIKRQLLKKQGDIRALNLQLKTYKNQYFNSSSYKLEDNQKYGKFKTQQNSYDSKQGADDSNFIIAQLRGQLKEISLKFEIQRSQRTLLVQKHRLQLSNLTTQNRLLLQQKSNLERKLSASQSQCSLNRKLGHDSSQNSISHSGLANSYKYVSSATYQSLKESFDKQKKIFAQTKDKLRIEINQLKGANSRFSQDLSYLKNQKHKVDGQLSRSQLQIAKLKSEIQKFKKQNQNLSKKLKLFENDINGYKGYKSYNVSPQNTGRESYQLHEEIKDLNIQNQSLKKVISQYKKLLNQNVSNSTYKNPNLHESELKEKNSYIKVLQTNVQDRDTKIYNLERQLAKYQNKGYSSISISNPNNNYSFNTQIQKLRDQIYKLKVQIQQLKAQKLDLQGLILEKEKVIVILNQRLQVSTPKSRNQKDLSMFIKDKSGRIGTKTVNNSFYQDNFSPNELRQQIEIYKSKYEKALETSNYLRQCLSDTKRTSSPVSCSICLQYQLLVSQLHRRINIYQLSFMAQLKNMFMSTQTKLNQTKYTWHQLQNTIFDLRSRTLSHKSVNQSFSSVPQFSQTIEIQSPMSLKSLPKTSTVLIGSKRRTDINSKQFKQ